MGVPLLALLFVASSLQDQSLQIELVLQFLVPLLAQVGWRNDEDVTFALCPALGNNQARFNGLTQAHLIGQDDALRERAAKCEECCLNLMGIQVHPRIDQRGGQQVRRIPLYLP